MLLRRELRLLSKGIILSLMKIRKLIFFFYNLNWSSCKKYGNGCSGVDDQPRTISKIVQATESADCYETVQIRVRGVSKSQFKYTSVGGKAEKSGHWLRWTAVPSQYSQKVWDASHQVVPGCWMWCQSYKQVRKIWV